MEHLTLVFPHQLFAQSPALDKSRALLIIEDPLFFGDFNYQLKFHKMKLTFHRASMNGYAAALQSKDYKVHYIDYLKFVERKDYLSNWITSNNVKALHVCKTDDFLLDKRLKKLSEKYGIKLIEYNNPSFLNSEKYLRDYFNSKKSYFQHYFYIDQRKKFNILIDDGKPIGGKWSLDSENRKSIKKDIKIPQVLISDYNTKYVNEAKKYVNKNFTNNPGENDNFYLPTSAREAELWFENFLEMKLKKFGDYQDAIIKDEPFLFHSIISPLINSGLLTPEFVLHRSLEFSNQNSIPLNSIEGFIRQILGWREFIRAVYLIDGVKQRNSNFWNHKRKIPKSFYDGTTGIEPVDATIKKLLTTGYNHHIERLMILGNFMLLCEIHPTEIYNWFMEMYIDSYDWVMVPNVYGMSQFADGGLMSTKPYISSSNYVIKMSNYKKGEWTEIWDSLFWNFIHKHIEYFAGNNRTIFMARNIERMNQETLMDRLKKAEKFLDNLK